MDLSYDNILRVWQEADQIPEFEHAWLWDHMVPFRGDLRAATLEAWTLLAALATQTRRLRMGVIVTSNRLRSPTLLAKMAATVDIISGGRLDVGIGVGGSRVAGDNPAVREYEAYGVPLVPPGDAVRDFAEACEILRRMWTETEPFDFDGRSLQLKGAVCEPKPLQHPHPPILIGGWGERVLRIVAEYADIWSSPAYTVEQFKEKDAVLRAHCAAIGRDPNEIVRSVQMIVRDDEPDAPASTRAGILELIDAGISHLVLVPLTWSRPVQWLADEIVAPVLAQVSPR